METTCNLNTTSGLENKLESGDSKIDTIEDDVFVQEMSEKNRKKERFGNKPEGREKVLLTNSSIEEEKDALVEKVTERRDYDDDYSKLLQLKQEMVEKEKKKKPWNNKVLEKFLKSFIIDKKLLITVVFLFVAIITVLLALYRLHENDNFYIYRRKNLLVNAKTMRFEFKNELQNSVMKGNFWKSKFKKSLPYDCSQEEETSPGDLCFHWRREMKVRIESRTWESLNVTCYDIFWTPMKRGLKLKDCFDMKEASWFGGGLIAGGGWPLNRMSFGPRPFVTGTADDKNLFGGVVEKYWLNSKGVGLFVADLSDIKVSINQDLGVGKIENQLCLYSSPLSRNLNYTVCVASNMKNLHQNKYLLNSSLPIPVQNNTLLDFSSPVWSTRRFNDSFTYNQENIHIFANRISKFDHKTFLMESGWEDVVGNLCFDLERFADTTRLFDHLHDLNFSVSLAVHTYLEPKSPHFQEASHKGFLMKNPNSQVPGLTLWTLEPYSKNKSVVVSAIEPFPEASEWFVKRLKKLQRKYSIASFHFTGGSISSLPSQFPSSLYNSNLFTKLYNDLASSFGPFAPVDTAYMSQGSKLLIKMSRRNSTWDGLKSVIASALNLNLAGYYLFIPEVAGGSLNMHLLKKELYIRWMQLNTFLPFVHYSLAPDEFDEETAAISKSLAVFRATFVIPAIKKFFQKSSYLQPLIQPLWWYSPLEQDAIDCDDEFVIGSKFLFAPILENGARNRNIYLPHGIWEDKPQDIYHIGPKWIFNYSVPLNKFAFFVKK